LKIFNEYHKTIYKTLLTIKKLPIIKITYKLNIILYYYKMTLLFKFIQFLKFFCIIFKLINFIIIIKKITNRKPQHSISSINRQELSLGQD